jgi:hypothetical protein
VRSDRRTLAILVHADGSVVVRAPRRAREVDVSRLLEARGEWIARKRREAAARPPGPRFVAGEAHRYLGGERTLAVEVGHRAGVRAEGATLHVTVDGDASPERVRQVLEAWYVAQAKRHLPARVQLCWSQFVRDSETTPEVRVRAMRSRWGSLSPNGKMSLNAHLMKAPLRCIDYVIFHELCHMRVRGHGPSFYAELSRYVPDWKSIRRELREAVV